MKPSFVGLASLGLAALACSDAAPSRAGLALGQRSDAIIGGLVASSPLLDHTGTLTYRFRETGQSDGLCSASLIGPQTLVTANHCISQMAFFEGAGIDVFWAPGPDFRNPIDEIPVVAVASAPGEEPGFARFGRDVGVAHLDRVSDGTPTIGVQPFDPELLGVSMVTLGYGISSAAGLIDGLRHIGRETVSKVEGNAYEGLFGDFETFVELSITGEATDTDIIPSVEADPTLADLDALRAEYDAALLIQDYEIVTGKAPGDTQSCELDSGGPLALVNAEGTWDSYGVVSAGPRLPRPVCVFGQVFAVFGPDTFDFLEAERSWQDPCGDVGVEGTCREDVLVRCDSSFERNVRQLLEDDCAAAGGECVSSETGAACSGAAEPPVADGGGL